jgi:ABC-type nitrate/sulfonate/bicarbonate transport system ATPase subunit
VSAVGQDVVAESAAASACLAFRDLKVVLGGKVILTGINLAIQRGEFLCVIGPSGCGKTTLLRLAAGLVPATAGEALYEGHPIRAPRRDVAVVFQDYGDALLPWRTAAGNIELVLDAMGVARAERGDRVHAALSKVALKDHARKFPAQMSGGMQQRLQIARCLAQEPKVWLMDEPFGALDAITRQKLQNEILGIVEESGATVLFVTHDLEEAIYLGDRVIGLLPHPGRIAECFAVGLPRPRDQRTTPEQPEFIRLRRALYDFIERSEA